MLLVLTQDLASLCHILVPVTPGTSLVVQWLSLQTPNAGGLGLIPGQGTRSHTLLLTAHTRHEDPAWHNYSPAEILGIWSFKRFFPKSTLYLIKVGDKH